MNKDDKEARHPFESLGLTPDFVKNFYSTVGRDHFKDFLSKFSRISMGFLHPDRTGKDELFRQISDAYDNLSTTPNLKVSIREYDSASSGGEIINNLLATLENDLKAALATKKKAVNSFCTFLEKQSRGDRNDKHYPLYNIIPCRLRLLDRVAFESDDTEKPFLQNNFDYEDSDGPNDTESQPGAADKFFYHIYCPSFGKIILKSFAPPKEYCFNDTFLIGTIDDQTFKDLQDKTTKKNKSQDPSFNPTALLEGFPSDSTGAIPRIPAIFPIGIKVNVKNTSILEAIAESGGLIGENSHLLIMIKPYGESASYYLLPELSSEKMASGNEDHFISPIP